MAPFAMRARDLATPAAGCISLSRRRPRRSSRSLAWLSWLASQVVPPWSGCSRAIRRRCAALISSGVAPAARPRICRAVASSMAVGACGAGPAVAAGRARRARGGRDRPRAGRPRAGRRAGLLQQLEQGGQAEPGQRLAAHGRRRGRCPRSGRCGGRAASPASSVSTAAWSPSVSPRSPIGSAPRRERIRARTAMTVAAMVMKASPKRPVKMRPVLASTLKTATKVRAAVARSPGLAVTNQRRPA